MIQISSWPTGPVFAGNAMVFEISCDGARVDAEVLAANVVVGDSVRAVLDGVAVFDLHSYVEAHLLASRDVVSVDGTVRIGLLSGWGLYRFRFTERTSAGVFVGLAEVSVVCLRGETDVDTAYLGDYVRSVGHVLSFAPIPGVLTVGGMVHFSWFNGSARALKLVAQFDFGGSVVSVVLEDWLAVVGIYHFALPYSYLAEKASEGWTAVSFWLRDMSNLAVSTVRRYLVLPGTDRDRWLVFENSVGGWDSFRAVGIVEEKLSFDRSTAETDNYNRTVAASRRRRFVLDTGPIAGQYLDSGGVLSWLGGELGGSREVYLLTPSKVTEVRVVSDDFTVFMDNDFNLPLSVELEAVRVTKAFTQPAAAIPPDWTPDGEGYYESGYVVPGYFD